MVGDFYAIKTMFRRAPSVCVRVLFVFRNGNRIKICRKSRKSFGNVQSREGFSVAKRVPGCV
jgi:hypothetical protein